MLLLLVLIGLIYLAIFLTHTLGLVIGTTGALAVMTLLAGIGCLLIWRAMRTEARRLAISHRKHVEQEQLALRAAGIEAVEASKLSGSIAAVSASLAAAMVLILRRLGPGEGAREEASPEG